MSAGQVKAVEREATPEAHGSSQALAECGHLLGACIPEAGPQAPPLRREASVLCPGVHPLPLPLPPPGGPLAMLPVGRTHGRCGWSGPASRCTRRGRRRARRTAPGRSTPRRRWSCGSGRMHSPGSKASGGSRRGTAGRRCGQGHAVMGQPCLRPPGSGFPRRRPRGRGRLSPSSAWCPRFTWPQHDHFFLQIPHWAPPRPANLGDVLCTGPP